MTTNLQRAKDLIKDIPRASPKLLAELQALVEPLRRGIDEDVTDQQWYAFCGIIEALNKLDDELSSFALESEDP